MMPTLDPGLGKDAISDPITAVEMDGPNADHRDVVDVPKSFKEALMPPTPDVDFSVPMQAQRKGEYLSIKVDENLVQNSISILQNSLIGKFTLAQGDAPYSLETLKHTLGQVWCADWQLIPLGRGYYNIQLSLMEDRNRILDRRSWSLKPGIIRLQRWVNGFNPYRVNSNLAQVWVRFYKVPMEFF